MEYPEEWNELPKHERRKKLRALKRQQQAKQDSLNKFRSIGLVIVAVVVLLGGYKLVSKKSPQQIEYQQQVDAVSLEGKVEEFPIEGRAHVAINVPVDYKTNPPTSGNHLAQANNWGVFSKELSDKAVVHSLEHGGIWISYKELDEASIDLLEEIGRANPQSVVVSPRAANDDKIAVVSWGRMMRLDQVDKAVIQKYIDTYKNNSPEQLAR